MINVKSEDQRIDATIYFIKKCIEELDREIRECDYEEAPDGKMVFSPGCYSYKKRMFEVEKRKLEIILDLLTREIPFAVLDW